jgi:hypothetical protein
MPESLVAAIPAAAPQLAAGHFAGPLDLGLLPFILGSLCHGLTYPHNYQQPGILVDR